MKKRITEKEMCSAVNRAIIDVLGKEGERMLNEMALPRKAYKEKVDSLIPQILENWCLVRYCTITGRTKTKNHWINELKGHLLTVSRYSIKRNDSVESRLKVLREIWEDYDYAKPLYLSLTVVNKFSVECMDYHSPVYSQVLSDCINSTQALFDAILSRDEARITSYALSV